MWTVSYKGFFIHGYVGCDAVNVPGLGRFATARAARLAISRAVAAGFKR